MLWDKFREGAEEAGKDASAMKTQLQVHVSWAPTQAAAEEQAIKEWPNGGMPFPKQDIKNPEDFANIAKLVRIENFKNRMLISADLEEHAAQLQNFVDMGFDEIYLHNVGRNQAEFISTFGEKVLPKLKLQ
jgi:alkanesulfonate monooxygenase SsuD/methylene tetrahydromethanopterin reductase-like flavin-dependent oxidoreductase (luciferase family)